MRPGSAAARRLFKRRTAEPFHNALAQYPAVVGRIQSRGTPRLKTLRGDDAWVLDELPALLAVKGRLQSSELQRLVRWKITRGKFRPLMGMVAGNSKKSVLASTAEACAAVGDDESCGDDEEMAALERLCELRGVGPATASVVLCALRPATCAFMADETIEGVGLQRAYTAKTWAAMNERLCLKGEAIGMTAANVGRALWVQAMLSREGALVESATRAASSESKADESSDTVVEKAAVESERSKRASKRRRKTYRI